MLIEPRLDESEIYYLRVKTAIEKHELKSLFLGTEDYMIPWSRWDMYDRGVKNNQNAIHTYLLKYKRKSNDSAFMVRLRRALLELCYQATPETLYIVANFIYLEVAHRSHNKVKPDLSELDLAELASCLEQKIQQKKSELVQERHYFGGDLSKEGVYGRLKGMSELSKERGGPSFV